MPDSSFDEDSLTMAIRKFLKEVGVTSQREIERVIREESSGKPQPSSENGAHLRRRAFAEARRRASHRTEAVNAALVSTASRPAHSRARGAPV